MHLLTVGASPFFFCYSFYYQSALFGIPLCGLSTLFPSNELAVFGREVEFIGVIILRLPFSFGLALPAPIAFSCARRIPRWLVVNEMLL
ncbi:hypothetical protein BDV39DRAFT_35454 [Aspergillus sergii]|uniref:Uncharacterized protein n=1 Tax=Aspergillus sergii TaxID=1034303 RepID=A0A5N6WIC7_9EURO|nr:hypothetical protein BDV39DRAFT_35454 [Aspergillus sergii]